jgi:hypothetical protein
LIDGSMVDSDGAVLVDRVYHERTTAAIGELIEALDQAAARGVTLAQSAASGTKPQRIERLAAAIRKLSVLKLDGRTD